MLAELAAELIEQIAQVDPFFGKVVEREGFAAEDGLGIDNFDLDADTFGDGLGGEAQGVAALFDLLLAFEIGGFGDSQDAPFGGERVIASAAVLNVLEHLFAGDAFGASGVGAGAGEHFAQFGATEGLDDHLAAAAGLDGSRMRELADQLHDAEADHHGLGGLEGLVDLPILFVKLGFEVGFELWKGKNGHGR